jgi:uncharacterized protein (TIGR03000 family)
MPQPAPPGIPFAPPEAAPGMSSLNNGLRPAAYNDSQLVSNGNATARATVVVKLPADARLYAETRALTLTGTERKFVSPELPAGQDFVYRFRAEYDRDGETVSITKKVAVRAGAVVSLEFADLTAKASPERNADKNAGGPAERSPTSVAAVPTGNLAPGVVPSVMPTNPVSPPASPAASGTPTTPAGSERATITVKLPAGAVLFVDDRKSPSNEPVRQFSTPPLPAGREYAYLMRAEIVRNGQTETFTQKVPFRAGERVEVDFTSVGR